MVIDLVKIESIPLRFYMNESGTEPVRDWLRTLQPYERKLIGEDLKTVQFGWPVGMPVVRPLGKGLFETRTTLKNKIARVLFCFRDEEIILLHGFVKKSQKTPKNDLALAIARMSDLKGA